MSSLQEPVDRPSARVLLLDGAGRILLFRAVEPRRRDAAPKFWVAPGGGVEAGESYQAAARRELDEETGLDAPIGRCVWRRTHTWYFARRDVWYRSCERYFVARTDVTDLVRDGWSALEQAAILAEDALGGPSRSPSARATSSCRAGSPCSCRPSSQATCRPSPSTSARSITSGAGRQGSRWLLVALEIRPKSRPTTPMAMRMSPTMCKLTPGISYFTAQNRIAPMVIKKKLPPAYMQRQGARAGPTQRRGADLR